MSIFYGVCESDRCNLEQMFEIGPPGGGRTKFVCRDCAGEMQALNGWRILRLQS